MANPNYSKTSPRPTGGKGSPPATGMRGTSGASVNEKTASWPGLPGKTGPDRSAGVKKLKCHPKQEGL